jgi:prevent-host-death family protein
MTIRNVSEAKAELSALLVLAEQGEEVIIARSGKPIVKLVSIKGSDTKPKYGKLKGKIRIADDFDAADPELEQMFYGNAK